MRAESYMCLWTAAIRHPSPDLGSPPEKGEVLGDTSFLLIGMNTSIRNQGPGTWQGFRGFTSVSQWG